MVEAGLNESGGSGEAKREDDGEMGECRSSCSGLGEEATNSKPQGQGSLFEKKIGMGAAAAS